MNKIIALSSGEYFHIMKKVFEYCKENLNSTIYAVTTVIDLKPYNSFMDSTDQLILLPNYFERQAWEDDGDQVAQIKSYVAKFEQSVQIPINRILLANERNIGRAYSKDHYFWPERKIVRYLLKDTEICNLVLLRMFKFVFDVINQHQPNICLGAPTGGMVNTIFYYVCKYLNVPYIAYNISVTVPNHHFWVSTWGSHNTSVAKQYQQKLIDNAKPHLNSSEYIERFREKPVVFPHLQKLWKQDTSFEFYKINKAIFLRLLHRVVAIVKRVKVSHHKPILPTVIDNYRFFYLKRRQQRFYKSYEPKALAEMKYIYYPFHLDPEFVLNVQAPFWHNQYNTIKLLSANLPWGYKLLIREHRYNVGRRATSYLKKLLRLPGVELITAFEDQYKYIANADLVVTVNGTSGFEGILLKRPVLTLDHTFYDALGYAKKFDGKVDLGTLIIDTMRTFRVSDDYDEKIALFLDAEKEVCLPHDAPVTDELVAIQQVLQETSNDKINRI